MATSDGDDAKPGDACQVPSRLLQREPHASTSASRERAATEKAEMVAGETRNWGLLQTQKLRSTEATEGREQGERDGKNRSCESPGTQSSAMG